MISEIQKRVNSQFLLFLQLTEQDIRIFVFILFKLATKKYQFRFEFLVVVFTTKMEHQVDQVSLAYSEIRKTNVCAEFYLSTQAKLYLSEGRFLV